MTDFLSIGLPLRFGAGFLFGRLPAPRRGKTEALPFRVTEHLHRGICNAQLVRGGIVESLARQHLRPGIEPHVPGKLAVHQAVANAGRLFGPLAFGNPSLPGDSGLRLYHSRCDNGVVLHEGVVADDRASGNQSVPPDDSGIMDLGVAGDYSFFSNDGVVKDPAAFLLAEVVL